LITLAAHADGLIVPVLAQPGAKHNAIRGERAGALLIAVTAPPEKGKANEAIQELLADALDCRTRQVTLIIGANSRRKRFLIAGLSRDELSVRLVQLVHDSTSSGSGT
jgi:uncharacterized protein (TIGR00251 family)